MLLFAVFGPAIIFVFKAISNDQTPLGNYLAVKQEGVIPNDGFFHAGMIPPAERIETQHLSENNKKAQTKLLISNIY